MKPQSLPILVRSAAEPVEKPTRGKHERKKASPDEAAFGAKLASAMAVDPVAPAATWRDEPPSLPPPVVLSQPRPKHNVILGALPRLRKSPLPAVGDKATPAKEDIPLLTEPLQNEEADTADADETGDVATSVALMPPSRRRGYQVPCLGTQRVVAQAEESTEPEAEPASVTRDLPANDPLLAPTPTPTFLRPQSTLGAPSPKHAPPAVAPRASPKSVVPVRTATPAVESRSTGSDAVVQGAPVPTLPGAAASPLLPAMPAALNSKGRAPVKDPPPFVASVLQAPAVETLSIHPQSKPPPITAVPAPLLPPVAGNQGTAEVAQTPSGGHSARQEPQQHSRTSEQQADLKQPLPSAAAPASPAAAPSLPPPQPPSAQPLSVHVSSRVSEPSASTTRASLLTGTDLLDLAPLGTVKIDVHNNEARVSVDTDSGALSLHVRVRNGVTDVSVDGQAAAHIGSHSRDLEAYLHKEGLTLGRFTVEDPRFRGGDSLDADGHQSRDSRQDADEADGTGHADNEIERPVSGEPAKVRSSGRVHVKA